MSKTLSRRSFLKVTSAGGALIIGASLPGLGGISTVEAAGSFEPGEGVT